MKILLFQQIMQHWLTKRSSCDILDQTCVPRQGGSINGQGDLYDELSRDFEPIEHLFHVFCAIDSKVYGALPQYCGVVGDQLAREFKRKMAVLLRGRGQTSESTQ